MFRLKDNVYATLSSDKGLPSSRISSIQEDKSGHFWIGTNAGIIRVKRAELQLFADRIVTDLAFQHFDQTDGMTSMECPIGFQSTTAMDDENRMWFATLKGVTMVHTDRISINLIPPITRINRITYWNEKAEKDTIILSGSGPFEIPPVHSNIIIHYSGLNFSAPEKTLFEYGLDSKEQTWSLRSKNSTAPIPHLPPGRFRFWVKARNHDGVWNKKPVEFVFHVRPHLWQTWYFRSLSALVLVIGIGSGGWFISRSRGRRQLERLEHENRLKKIQVRLALILENTSDCVAFSEPDGTTLYINPSGRRILGLDPQEDIRGIPIKNWYSDQSMNRILTEGFPIALKQGIWSGQSFIKKKTGEEIPVSQVIMTHKNEDGSLDFTSTIIRDISEIKKVETTLRRNEELLKTQTELLEQSQRSALVGGWEYNVRSSRIYLTRETYRIYEIASEHWIPTLKSMIDFCIPNHRSRFEQAIDRSVETGNEFDFEAEIITAEEQRLWIRVTGSPKIENGQTVKIFGSIQDIQSRKEQEEKLRNQEEKSRQSQKLEAIGTLAGGIAHDFNNILTGIFGYLDLLKERTVSDDETQNDLHEIDVAASRAKQLVHQILTYSRQDKSIKELTKVQDITTEALKLLRASLPTSIKISTKLNSNASPVMAAPDQIHQIIMNLATNAAQSMENDTGRLSFDLEEVELNAEITENDWELKPGSYIQLTISDSGKGMDSAVQKRIFDPFFTTKRADQGTGLGLSVVLGIVKSHGGMIQVESSPGQGTRFRIFLPCVEQSPTSGKEKNDTTQKGNGETVMFIDDEDSIARMVSRMLVKLDYKPEVYTSSLEAAKMFHQNPNRYALILSDFTMSGMNGADLISQIRKVKPHLPIILTSGASDKINSTTAEEMGASGFLQKPYNLRALSHLMHRVLKEKFPPIQAKPAGFSGFEPTE